MGQAPRAASRVSHGDALSKPATCKTQPIMPEELPLGQECFCQLDMVAGLGAVRLR